MGVQSVKIPVELELQKLQSSINTLQAAFDKVKPGTKIYNDISRQLEKAKKDFLNLQIASEKAFSNTAEVTKFEKSFGRVTDEITTAARMLEQLDFDSLNFSTEDLKSIQTYKDRISEINKELGNIKTDALKQLYANSQDLQDTFKELSLNINTTSLDKAVKDVSAKTKQIRKQVEGFSLDILGKEAERDKATKEMASLEKLKDTVKNLTDPRFFKANKTFKNTQVFKDWLKSLGLDQESSDKLIAEGAKNMARIYPEIEKAVQTAIGKKSTTISNADKALVSLEAKRAAGQASLSKYESSLGQLEGIEIDPKLAQQIQSLQEEAQRSRLEIEKLKKELVETKGPAKDAGEAVEDLSDNLEEIHSKSGKAAQGIEQAAEATKKFNNIQDAIKRWFGFNEVINLTKRLVTQAISHIRELDDVMTQIAIVTDMTQQELWDQMDTYSNMARQYGASIKGVYEVSQLYYQQGLQAAEVMELTAETLKMAKIANLEYSDATNYMTVALRGFKLEMSEASTVTDVYSALAAATASDTQELAVAMSKTASSAEAVGSSFEATSAMIATMVSVTREAPENIGSALKSIISRYGEMTTNPLKLIDAEGEEMSLNKVDKALQSVGISLQDANGNFRDFDDVILELSKSWDTIDINTQRYIATIMAGNRQQSRFLALVGNYEEYAKALSIAENAEGAGTLQALKYMDSLSAKWEQFKVSIQEFYTSSGLEDIFKGVLDSLTKLVKVAARTPKMFKAIPVSIIALVTTFVHSLKKTGMQLLSAVEGPLEKMKAKLTEIKGTSPVTIKIKTEIDPNQVNQTIDQAQAIANGRSPIIVNNGASGGTLSSNQQNALQAAFSRIDAGGTAKENYKAVSSLKRAYGMTSQEALEYFNKLKTLDSAQRQALLSGKSLDEVLTNLSKPLVKTGAAIAENTSSWKQFLSKTKGNIRKYSDVIGLATSALSAFIATQGEVNSKQNDVAQAFSGGINIVSGAARMWAGDYLGGAMQIISGIGPLFDGLHYSLEEQLEYATAKAEELNNKAVQAKADYDTIKSSTEQLKILEEQRYDSAEAAEEYQEAANELGRTYPQLIEGFDEMGNVILDLTNSEEILAKARKESLETTIQASRAEAELSRTKQKELLSNFKEQLTEVFSTYGLYNSPLAKAGIMESGVHYWAGGRRFSFDAEGKSEAERYAAQYEEETGYATEVRGFNDSYQALDLSHLLQFEGIERFYKNPEEGFSIGNVNWDQVREYANSSELDPSEVTDVNKALYYLELVYDNSSGYLQNVPENFVTLDYTKMNERLQQETEMYAQIKGFLSGENVTTEDLNNLLIEWENFRIENPYSELSTSYWESFQLALNEGGLAGITQDLELEKKIEANYTKQEISSTLALLYETEHSFIEESAGLLSLVQNHLYSAYLQAKENGEIAEDVTAEQYVQDHSNDLVLAYSNFWESLDEEEQSAFNKLLSNYSNYTETDFNEALKSFGLLETDDIFIDLVRKYQEAEAIVRDRFTQKITTLSLPSKLGEEVTNISELLAYGLLDKFSAQISYAVESNDLDMIGPITALYEELNNNLGPEAERIAANADLFTLSGIYQFIEDMEEAGFSIETETVNSLLDAVNINFNTEWETFFTTATSELEALSEALSSATEGMGFEEAYKMATKLGVQLSDFEFIDGEYFFRDAEAIIEAYSSIGTEYQNELVTRTQEEIPRLRGLYHRYRREGNWDSARAVQEQIQELQQQLALSETELDEYIDHMTDVGLLSAGFYSNFVARNTTGKTEEEIQTITDEMLAAARQGEQELIAYLTSQGITYSQEYIETIIGNMESIASNVVEAVINAKGRTIDISHYLVDSDLEGDYTTIATNSEATIQQLFRDLFGSNTEAYNEAYVQWLESQTKNYQTVFEDIVSNPREVDLSTVEEFANALGITVDTAIKAYFKENADGTYSVLDSTLQSLPKGVEVSEGVVQNIENAQDLIADSLIAYTDEILGYISSGISGDLSNVEFSKLGEYIASLTDGQVSLSFERTAEGIKLTQSSLLQIYSTLQANNSLAAQIVLDELTESAMDADENLNNIYKVMERIAEINEELSTAEISDEREKALRAELALAENIRDTLMEAGDAFNFMDQDLPTGMTNPLSAWEGMGEAFNILGGDDFAANRIGFQDFYNMITMMGDEVLGNAEIFGDKTTTAAELIESAAEALTMVDGEAFVDLGKLGANFNLGAEEMGEGLEAGIDIIAQNQIDMLDAEIALLETVVKTQEAFDSIDKDDNSKIDLGEFNPFRDEDGNLYWSTQQETLLNNLDTYIEGTIQLSDRALDLNDLITNPNIWQGLKEEDKQRILDYFNLIQNLTSEIDWSLSPTENFEAFKTLATQLQESGLNIDWNSLIDSWTSGLDETSAGEIKRKIIQHLGGTVSEEGTITIPYTYGNATFKMTQTESGEPVFKSPLGFEGKTPQEALEKEYEAQGGADLYGDIENYKIVMGYTVEPQVEIEPEALAGLDGEVRNKIAEVINGDGKVTEDTVDALVSLGFEVQVGDELSSDQIAALRSALNIEDKIINLTVNTEGISENIVGVLDGTVTEIPVTLNLGTGEEGESLSVNADSVIVTVAENGLSFQNPDGSSVWNLPSVEALAEVLNLTDASTVTYGTNDEGNDTVIITDALDANGNLGNLTLTRNADGTYTTTWTNKPTEVELDEDIAATGDMSQFTASFTAETIRTTDATGEVLVDVSSVTFTASGLGEDGTQLVDVPVTVSATPTTTYEDIRSQVIAGLVSQGFSETTAEAAATPLVNAYIGLEEAPDNTLATLEELQSYTSTNPLTSYWKVNQDGADDAASAIQSIIDAYNNTDVTLNINLHVNEGNSLLADQYLTGDTTAFNASPTPYAIQRLAQGNSLYGFGSGNIQGSYGIALYLQALKTDISQITPADLQILEDLNTIVSNFKDSGPWPETGEEYFSWAGDLAEVNALMAESPLFTTTEEGSTTLTSTLNSLAQIPSLEPIVQAIIDVTTNSTSLSTLDFSNFNSFIDNLISLSGENGTVVSGLQSIKEKLEELTAQGYNIELAYNITSTSDAEGTYDVTINDNGTAETLTNLGTALTHLNTQAAALKDSANAIETTGPDNVKALKEQINNLQDKSTAVGNTADAIARLDSKTISAKIIVNVSAPDGSNVVARTKSIQMTTQAKGNVALSKGTLMGELGPELVVAGGRYFTVGNNGAEFVDLPDDAIVFNHLQTQRLLSSGSSGRGDPVTNEKKAIAFAGGNVTGPAMASAESALAELKAIRAMWTALLNQDAKSLGKKAGSGGGGGGGGGSDKENAAYIHDLERWYNLLRQIEKLEEQITYEQAKRENMRSGYDYSKSLQKELDLLKEQRKVYEDLSRLQKDYYNKRRQDLLSTDYSKIFTYDEDGLMQYVDGKDRGLDILATLNATDAYGKAKMNASQQLAYLRSVGFNTSVLNTNVDGTKAENDEQRVQNFWDGVDSWMAELDDLYDSYNEAATNMEEATQAINEILQEYIDNQLAVEEKLMQAIQDREQAEIDRIQDEKDALDEAAQEYINGLNEALNKERDMYQKNETDAETAKLQRQLAILQRSGGSTSEIKSLQDQIDSRLQDAYFQEQQDQIDAIQEASDNQLEKLQTQIDLMTETLEYQKEHGLLWQEVYEMMNNWSPEQMLQFIEQYTQEYQQNSALQNQQNSEETQQQLEMWDDDRQNKERDKAWTEYYEALDYEEKIKEDNKAKAQAAYNAAYATDGAAAAEAAANKVFEEAKTNSEQQNSSNSAPAEPAPAEPPATLTGVLTGGNVNMRSSASTSSGVVKKIAQGTTVTLTGMSSSKKNGYYWFKASAGGKTGYMAYTSRWGNFSGDINTLPKFEKGGLVDFTGPAWVDGSKTKPEAFLSAEDTAMLKSKIFSNSDGSLKALVAALEAITDNTSKYSAQTNTESIVIQNAQVNIQPGTISNDYDARRAGEMALEEMVKIARKTTNRVVSR